MKTIAAGKYRLNVLLGSGGMAEVWSATNTFTERDVAIKFLSERVAKSQEATTRFLKEAKVSARVNHPNIIDIIDVGQTEEGQLFLVMELLTGMSLDTALKRPPPRMSLHELARIMLDVAEALGAAHLAGIVHRDLKPSNVFLHAPKNGAGRATTKLLDFGVSKFLEDTGDHALTMAGTVLGSPLYMSPEQARGEADIDGRTDVFAFGSILFEALTGHRPYEARNFNALIVKIATSPPKDIDEHAAHAPESIRRVVRACMDPDVELRAQSFVDVIAMLREALPELEGLSSNLTTCSIGPAPLHPDATGAVPAVRASDLSRVLEASPSKTPGPYATTARIRAPKPRRRARWGFVAGTTLLVAAVGLGAVIAVKPRFVAGVAPLARPPESASVVGAIGELTPSPDERPAATATASVASSAPSAKTTGRPPKVLRIDELPSAKPGAAPRRRIGPRAGKPAPGGTEGPVD